MDPIAYSSAFGGFLIGLIAGLYLEHRKGWMYKLMGGK